MPRYQFTGTTEIIPFIKNVVLSATRNIVDTPYILEAQQNWDPTKITRLVDAPYKRIAVYSEAGTVSSIPGSYVIDHTVVPDLSKANTVQLSISNGGILQMFLNDNTDPNKSFTIAGNDKIIIKLEEYTLDKIYLNVINAAGLYSLNVWIDGDIRRT